MKQWHKVVLGLSIVCLVGGSADARVYGKATPPSGYREYQAKTITVEGVVVDESGIPLSGVSVHLTSTPSKGTVSDESGNYIIPDVPSDGKLTFSMIGMKSQTIAIEGRSWIKITLREDSELLGEVVVTGYQEVKKERMTGTIATINANDIKNFNLNSMDQVLVGRISGVSAVVSGRPGAQASINIRGTNSLTGNTQPVWIVDGMPLETDIPKLNAGGNIEAMLAQGGIGNIAPDDIASITVLKDAAATAIYGARAANGVIVVTTKRGEESQSMLNLSAQFGITQRPVNNIRMMSSEEKVLFERQTFDDINYRNTGRVGWILSRIDEGSITRDEGERQIEELEKINTDWYRELYRPAYATRIHGTMSGGNKKTTYYTSSNFVNETGTELNNLYRRLLVKGRLDHRFSDALSMGGTLSGTYRTDRHTASAVSPLEYAMFANPYETPDSPDMSWDMTRSSSSDHLAWQTLNVREDLLRNTASSRYIDLTLNAYLTWNTPLKGLVFKSHGKGSISTNTSRNIEGENTYTNFLNNWLRGVTSIYEMTPEMARGSLQEGYYTSDSFTWRNTLEYSLSLHDTHHINLFGGSEISGSEYYSATNYSPVFDERHRIIGFPNLPGDTKASKLPFTALGSTGRWESRLSSFFLNGSYSFADRYILSASVRYDGSDIIGNKNQFTPLWNASAKWNVHNEPFFHKNPILSHLALRGGYGYTGSIDKNALPFVVMTIGKSILYDGQTVPTKFSYANPDIKWQTKRDFNIGIETAWLRDRLRLNLNYYNNFVFDLLDDRSLPYSSGRSRVKKNTANLRNTGVEAEIYLELIRQANFGWSVSANMAYNKNIITETYYKDIAQLGKHSGGTALVQGYSVGSWFGHRFSGINPYNGHTLALDDEGKDFDMDLLADQTLKLTAPTLTHLGESNPPFIGGFSSDLFWGRLTMNVSFEFRAGHLIESFNTFRGLDSHNRHISDITRWRAPGDEAQIPEIGYISTAYAKYFYDAKLERGDYVRMTYATIGYNISPKIYEKLGLRGARLALTANNLFTLTRYKGIDPSLGGSFGYPVSPRYTLSVNLNF